MKYTYICICIFIIQNRPIHRDRKQISDCQGIGEERVGGGIFTEYKVYFKDNEKVIKLEIDGCCMTL